MWKGSPRSYVGLAARAGHIACGTMACQQAFRRGQAYLLLLAWDCGTTTRLRFERLARRASVPWMILPEGIDPGAWVGRPRRVVLVIKDRGLAQATWQAFLDKAKQDVSTP